MVQTRASADAQPIVVKKFGGSSVADVERIKAVADHVVAERARGLGVVVVVSAMGKTTDSLVKLAQEVTHQPDRREMDMLLTAGERISMSLLAIAIRARGLLATSLTGSQSGIITNDFQGGARIVEVRPYRVQDALAQGHVVIVAGFQGVSYRREVTTLGRGGSDTTAVALAAALGAQACEIYSDIDGVYSADPRVVLGARRLASLSHDEMIEMARAGAKVLAEEAVAYARLKDVALYVRASDGRPGETMVRCHPPQADSRISAVATRPGARLWHHSSEPAVETALDRWLVDEGIAPLQRTRATAPGAGSLLFARDAADTVGTGFEQACDVGRGLLGEALLIERRGTLLSLIGTAVGCDVALGGRFSALLRARLPDWPLTLVSHGLTLSALVPPEAADTLACALHAHFVETP